MSKNHDKFHGQPRPSLFPWMDEYRERFKREHGKWPVNASTPIVTHFTVDSISNFPHFPELQKALIEIEKYRNKLIVAECELLEAEKSALLLMLAYKGSDKS